MDVRDLLKPRNVDEKGASLIVGKISLFRRMVSEGWISPIVSLHACTLFAVRHVEGCCDLLEAGFLPGKKDPSPAEKKAAHAGAMRPAYAKA